MYSWASSLLVDDIFQLFVDLSQRFVNVNFWHIQNELILTMQVVPEKKPRRRHQKHDPMLQHGAHDGLREAEHGEKESVGGVGRQLWSWVKWNDAKIAKSWFDFKLSHY